MKNLLLVSLLFVGMSYASAQDVYTSSGKPGYHKKTKKKKGYDPDKVIIGGGFTAGFGDGYIAAGISPIVGYRLTDHFAAGVGLGYIYYQNPDPEYSPPITYKTYYDKENIISPNVWARYFVWRGLYVPAVFEYNFIGLSLPDTYYDQYGNPYVQQDKLNVQVPSLLLGIGYKMPLGGRVSAFIEGMIDVLQQPNSPYLNQPVFRAGICAGL